MDEQFRDNDTGVFTSRHPSHACLKKWREFGRHFANARRMEWLMRLLLLVVKIDMYNALFSTFPTIIDALRFDLLGNGNSLLIGQSCTATLLIK